MNRGQLAAAIHRRMVDDNRFGYSWGERWGANPETWSMDGVSFTMNVGDYDCSSSCITAWKKALTGTEYANALDRASYTGNMRSVFVDSGLFEWKPMSFLAQPGDLYLNETNHVAMCQTQYPDILSEFCISETGGTSGKRGDQTGREAYAHDYYDYPWDGILHYNGAADSKYGWIQDEHGWWYRRSDGSWPCAQWEKIGGQWYHFNDEGYMQTGWLKDNGAWYYLDEPDGYMHTGWVKWKSKWYWLYDSGQMAEDCFIKIGGKWYAFGKSGAMVEKSTNLVVNKNGDITIKETK